MAIRRQMCRAGHYEDSENSEKATGTPITSAGGEWVEAPEVVSVTAQVCSTRFASERDARMELWRNAQHKHPQKSDGNENSHRACTVVPVFIAPALLSAYQNPQDYFFDDPGGGSALLSDLFPHR
jgi:hypothetical protein